MFFKSNKHPKSVHIAKEKFKHGPRSVISHSEWIVFGLYPLPIIFDLLSQSMEMRNALL